MAGIIYCFMKSSTSLLDLYIARKNRLKLHLHSSAEECMRQNANLMAVMLASSYKLFSSSIFVAVSGSLLVRLESGVKPQNA